MCHLTGDTVEPVPSDSRGPRLARELFDLSACATHNPHTLDAARLLVSEVVTNAVRYGAPPIHIEIRCIEHIGLRVAVSDANPIPPTPLVTDPHDESGRGMALVELFSDEWGVVATHGGKQVWFRFNPARTS